MSLQCGGEGVAFLRGFGLFLLVAVNGRAQRPHGAVFSQDVEGETACPSHDAGVVADTAFVLVAGNVADMVVAVGIVRLFFDTCDPLRDSKLLKSLPVSHGFCKRVVPRQHRFNLTFQPITTSL